MESPGPGPEPPEPRAGDTDAARALRAQLLATEHWSILASRSTTQSEVLTRIAIFLTLVSAGLVSLGLLGQATEFTGVFGWAAIGVLTSLAIVGTLTEIRVFNAAGEDLMYVAAMNRLRGAYVDLDPTVRQYLVASPHDDQQGIRTTYYAYDDRNVSQVLGSSFIFIAAVNAVIAGLLGAGIVRLAGGVTGLAVGVGVGCLIVMIVVPCLRGNRLYRHAIGALNPLRPTPERPAGPLA